MRKNKDVDDHPNRGKDPRGPEHFILPGIDKPAKEYHCIVGDKAVCPMLNSLEPIGYPPAENAGQQSCFDVVFNVFPKQRNQEYDDKFDKLPLRFVNISQFDNFSGNGMGKGGQGNAVGKMFQGPDVKGGFSFKTPY
jgi:hypothetical protein